MRLGRAIGEHLGGQTLPRKRRWNKRQRLGRRSHFAWNIGCRIRLLFDREQWFAGCALKQVDEALFRRLRQRVDSLPIARHRQQHRRRRKVAVPDIVVHSLKVP